MKIWREETLQFRDKDTQGNNAVVVGWDTSQDSTKRIPQYHLSFLSSVDFDSTSTVFVSIAQGNPAELKDKKSAAKKKDENELLINFTIELEDSIGTRARVELNALKKLTPRLKIQYEKLSLLQKSYGDIWEPTFETFEISLGKFKDGSALKNIKYIRFIFDRTKRGVLILDEIGGQKMGIR